MTELIKAFLSFKQDPNGIQIAKRESLFPTEGDQLLSALEPFREAQSVVVKVYDLETTTGRLMGLLNDVNEAPSVIIAGQRHIGLTAATRALNGVSQNGIRKENV